MSHRILKTGINEPRGLFIDISDAAESYYYWMKDRLSTPWKVSKETPLKNGFSISEYRTSNVVVHHATDDDDDDDKIKLKKTTRCNEAICCPSSGGGGHCVCKGT
jgi:hypothetical protein